MNLIERALFGDIGRKIDRIQQGLNEQRDRLDRKLEELARFMAADTTLASLPGERVFDLARPGYEQNMLRKSGKIFNGDKPCTNPAFVELMKRADGDEVGDAVWHKILAENLVEASSVPGAAQLFERQAYLQDYLLDLGRKYRSRYAAGWVTQDDALFLYWLVRSIRPRRILQCGAVNGRSSAFMMLALAKNGPDGRLGIIDKPPIFDPEAHEWTAEGNVHSAVVPTGKTAGWMVPDQYRDRLEVWNGEPKDLLAKVVDDLDGIDLFYYASDRTYRHMMSMFEEARRKLRKDGLVVAVDVGWNASLWDFTDRHGVPSYTFKSAVGVGFF